MSHNCPIFFPGVQTLAEKIISNCAFAFTPGENVIHSASLAKANQKTGVNKPPGQTSSCSRHKDRPVQFLGRDRPGSVRDRKRPRGIEEEIHGITQVHGLACGRIASDIRVM